MNKTTCEKISLSRIGKHYPKISQSKRELLKDKTKHPMYGKHHSLETIEKLREKAKEPQRVLIAIANLSKTKDKPNPMLGKHHTDEAKDKMRQHKLGKPGYWKNKKILLTPKILNHLAEMRLKGKIIYPRGYWYGKKSTMSQEGRNRVTKKCLESQRNKKPNNPETILGKLIEQVCPNKYKYVGNGQLIIGRMCPDYANINGQKKLIEMYGSYWHREQNPQNRIDKFKEFGFDCLIIWQHELYNTELVKKKIFEFTG